MRMRFSSRKGCGVKASERLKAAAGGNMAASIGEAGTAGSSLLPRSTGTDMYTGLARLKGALLLPVDRVFPDPDQPRQEFDAEEIERLALSLKDRGQLQPIRVRPDPSARRWIIIAGERRWRAAQHAGLAQIAAVEISGELSPEMILEDQLVENCLRVDLRPIEQARAFKILMDRLGLTQTQLARRLNVSLGSVNGALSLLTLPETVQQTVEQGGLPASSAILLTKLSDPAEQQRLATEAVEAGLSRSEIKATVSARAAKNTSNAPKERREDIRLSDGERVVVILSDPLASDSAVQSALKRALNQFTRERRDVA